MTKTPDPQQHGVKTGVKTGADRVTLDDLRAFVARADEAEIPGSTGVRARVTLRGYLREVEVTG